MDNFHADLAAGVPQFQHLGRALQQHAEVDQDFFSRRLLGKTQQVRDQIARPAGLVHNLAEQLVLFVGEVLLGPELLRITHDGGQGMVNLMSRSGHQVAEGSQLFFLHELALQTLLAFIAAARFLQQCNERLVLQILAQEDECAQHQHGGQHGENAERARGSRRVVGQHGPHTQDRQGQQRQHGEPGNDLPPPERVQGGRTALRDPIRARTRRPPPSMPPCRRGECRTGCPSSTSHCIAAAVSNCDPTV